MVVYYAGVCAVPARAGNIFIIINAVPVAQRIRRETTNLEIAGSNPVGDNNYTGGSMV